MSFRAPPGSRTLIEHHPKLTVAYFAEAAGGRRRLRHALRHDTPLPDGRVIRVRFALVNHGFGKQLRIVCGRCERTCLQLHVLSLPPGLVCLRCLQRTFRVKYQSQIGSRIDVTLSEQGDGR